MRVMYVITRGDDIGGAQMMVRDLAIGTRERGHEVRVVTGIGGPLTEQLADHGIESRICPGMLARDRSPPGCACGPGNDGI